MVVVVGMLDRLVLRQGQVAVRPIHVYPEHQHAVGGAHDVTGGRLARQHDVATRRRIQPRVHRLGPHQGQLVLGPAAVQAIRARVHRQAEQIGTGDRRIAQYARRLARFVVVARLPRLVLGRARGAQRFVHIQLGALLHAEAGHCRAIILEADHTLLVTDQIHCGRLRQTVTIPIRDGHAVLELHRAISTQ
ncbi:hypothetical protein D3C78_1071350 [compost metagenome]